MANSAARRPAEIPAVNGHGTAAAVAGFCHALATGRLLSPGMLAEAVTPQCTGPDRVSGEDNAWELGFSAATTATAWASWAETTRAPAPRRIFDRVRDRQRRKL